MGQPFEQWSARVDAATDDETRRSLMAEVALWRARRLHDIVASRRATFALSRLHHLLQDREAAVREARSLLSLCQTPPVASREEVNAATSHLEALGETVPAMPGMDRGRRTRRGRDEPRPRGGPSQARSQGRPARDAAPRKPDALAEARDAAARGEVDKVHQIASGRAGPTWALVRVHADLTHLRQLTDPDALRAGLESLQGSVARSLSIGGKPAGTAAAPPTDDPLSQLLGQAVPKKRGPMLRAIERFADLHPEQLDALAAAALQHHVATHGVDQPAPWLVGTVGRAIAHGEAPQTTAAIEALRSQGAVAVLAYDEWAFSRLLRLMKSASAGGWTVSSLRRGVLSRGEPAERKLWTLRLGREGESERMVVVGPHATEPYEEQGKDVELAERVVGLCQRSLVLATGSGNAGLRDAAAASGLPTRDTDADDAQILQVLADLGDAPSSSPSAPDRLVEVLGGDAVAVDALVEVLQGFRRPTKSFRVAERAEPGDAATAGLLTAVAQVVDPAESLQEGTTLAVRVASAHPDGATRSALLGSLQERYGGPALGPVTQLATALVGDGWHVFRVLRGPTRRERQQHPVLETLADAMQGLWRVLVRRDALRGEVWFVADLPPEGRAGIPQLLLEDRQRAVVLPVEPEVLSWYGQLGGPEAIGWTGSEADALLQAVASWQPDPPRPVS